VIIKPAVGFPGYFVTDTGKILSTKKVFREIKSHPNEKGYHQVSVRRNGRSVTVKVHHVIAVAFHGPRPQGLVGAHLDGDKNNNTPGNIEWVTDIVNNSHKREHGTLAQGSKINMSKLKEHQIPAIRELIAQGRVLREIGDIYGVNYRTISHIKNKVTWNHVPMRRGRINGHKQAVN
jgi:hypothetical protein